LKDGVKKMDFLDKILIFTIFYGILVIFIFIMLENKKIKRFFKDKIQNDNK